jgi:cyclophilin family peptidyl-prolyl cis-trans isomerase
LTLFLPVLLVTALCAQSTHPRVLVQTTAGDITVELYPDKAPTTVANFLRYVEAGHYAGGSFFRSVTMQNQPNSEIRIEVIQAGVHPWQNNFGFEAIPLERTDQTGLRHVDGAVSMARADPNSATSSFFICVGDQPELDYGGRRNPDGQGFAVFGRVVDGMEVVREIHQSPTRGQALVPAVSIRDAALLHPEMVTDQVGGPQLDWTPPQDTEVFMPGLISTDLGERDATFHPDGNEFYFTLWSGRFGTIMRSSRSPSGWAKPETASFSGRFSDLEPFVTPDGQRLFFASNRPLETDGDPADYNLWYVLRESSGWGAPMPVEGVNTTANEFYPSLDRDGRLFWTAAYDGGFGGEDIYYALPQDSGFSKPVNVGAGVNTERDEFNAMIAPDGSWLAFGSFGRDDGHGGGDLYISFKSEADTLDLAINMGSKINSSGLDFCPSLTADGAGFLFSSRRTGIEPVSEDRRTYQDLADALRGPGNGRSDLYWIDAQIIEELRALATQ